MRTHSHRTRPWLLAGLLAVATLATFGRTASFDLLMWDDNLYISASPRMRPPDLQRAGAFWVSPHYGMFIPATYTLWTLETWLTDPTGGPGDPLSGRLFHAVQVLLHAGCALLVLRLLRRWTGHDLGAAAGAALFALHPVQVESVAWVSETRGTLSALFALIALGVHTSYEDPRRHLGRYAAATTSFALALLSKPTAVVVPLLALVLDVGLDRQPRARRLAALGLWVAMAAAVAFVTPVLQAQMQAGTSGSPTPIWARPWIALDALGFYVAKLFWPFGLGPDYGRTAESVLAAGWPPWTWGVALGALVAPAVVAGRRKGWVALGVFLAALMPVLGIVPFQFQNLSTVADRYLYLALLGPALAVAWLLGKQVRPAVAWAALLVLVLLGAASYRQAGHWRDTRTLFEHALRVNPRSFVAHNDLGLYWEQTGDPERALRHYEEALRIKPDHFRAHVNIGNIRWRQGDLKEAIRRYRSALAIEPSYWKARMNLGRALLADGAAAEAAAELGRVVEQVPDNESARRELARALAAR